MTRIRTWGASLLLGFSAVGALYACVGTDPEVARPDGTGDAAPADGSTPASDAAASDASPPPDGGCGDTTTADTNCGSCGHACGADEGCFASTCVKKAIDVSAGANSACAVRKDGSVWCWGDNRFGEVGVDLVGGVTCGFACRPRAVQVPGLSNVTQISVGYQFACAVDNTNVVRCWGKNHRFQLGHNNAGDPTDGAGVQYNSTPAPVTGLPASTYVAAGTEFACAVTTTGAVYCWGNHGSSNLFDQDGGLAPGSYYTATRSAYLTSGVDALALAVTYGGASDHACAHVSDGGTVFCWGTSVGGERGSSAPSGSPSSAVLLADGGIARGLGTPTAGVHSSCTSSATGAVTCWGRDQNGAFANGNLNADHPSAIPGNTGGPSVGPLSGNADHVCARGADGKAYCWGSNRCGQLGIGALDAGTPSLDGTYTISGAAVGVPNFKAVKVAAGNNFAVAIREDGSVWAWGRNTNGEIGHPQSASDVANCCGAGSFCTLTPTQVEIAGQDAGL